MVIVMTQSNLCRLILTYVFCCLYTDCQCSNGISWILGKSSGMLFIWFNWLCLQMVSIDTEGKKEKKEKIEREREWRVMNVFSNKSISKCWSKNSSGVITKWPGLAKKAKSEGGGLKGTNGLPRSSEVSESAAQTLAPLLCFSLLLSAPGPRVDQQLFPAVFQLSPVWPQSLALLLQLRTVLYLSLSLSFLLLLFLFLFLSFSLSLSLPCPVQCAPVVPHLTWHLREQKEYSETTESFSHLYTVHKSSPSNVSFCFLFSLSFETPAVTL